MTKSILVVALFCSIGSALVSLGCNKLPLSPAQKPTRTPTPGLSVTFTSTSCHTFISTSTATFTPTPNLSATSTSTSSNTFTFTITLTRTLSNTPFPTITSTLTSSFTPTPSGTWNTSTSTFTPCRTATATLTGTCPPGPFYFITGTVNYTGTGTVDAQHPLIVSGGDLSCGFYSTISSVTSSGATYLLGTNNNSIHSVSALYQKPGQVTLPAPFTTYYPISGRAFTSSNACGTPAMVESFPVTITGPTGSTIVGPAITVGDTCSYMGLYGGVRYTGAKGTVQICRRIYLKTYLDAGFSNPAPYAQDFLTGMGTYEFVTNGGSGVTGNTPLYLRAYFDANGTFVFDTGDPYLEVGPVSPASPGTLQMLDFDDTFIR